MNDMPTPVFRPRVTAETMREYMRPTKRLTARFGVGKRPHINGMAPWHRWYWLDGHPALSVVPDSLTVPIEWHLRDPATLRRTVALGDRWSGIAYEAAMLAGTSGRSGGC